METIGERLRKAREDRGISIEQVARDTNISKSYIQALEEDRYDVFPAEPYIMGFLRTYSDHLGLETEQLLSQYKNFKIQEQPAPMTALLEPKKSFPAGILVVLAVLASLVVLALIFTPAIVDFVKNFTKPGKELTNTSTKDHLFAEDKPSFTQRLYKEDVLNIVFEKETYKFMIKSIGENLVLATPTGESTLKLSEEKFVDLDNNGTMDLLFFP